MGNTGGVVHLVGGIELDVSRQGIKPVRRHLERAHEIGEFYAKVAQPDGPAFVDPLLVKYLRQPGDQPADEPRQANARVHFADGSFVEIVQGNAVATRRLSEARASLALFATFVDTSGSLIAVNCRTVTHLTSVPGTNESSSTPPS